MSLSRRRFISTGFKSLVMISASGILESFSAGEYHLPATGKIRLRFAVASDGHYGQPKTAYEALHDDMVGLAEQGKEGPGASFQFYQWRSLTR
jgi:hypothetical protein